MEGVGCDPLLHSLTNLGDEVGAAAAVGTAAVPLGLGHNQVCLTGCLCRETGDLEFASSDSSVEFSSGHGSGGHGSDVFDSYKIQENGGQVNTPGPVV